MATEEITAASAVNVGSFTAARMAYERGRFRLSLAIAAPVIALPLVSWMLSGRIVMQAVLGIALLLVVTFGIWRGQAFGRGTALGVLSGMVPLMCAHAAKLYGHICTPSGCTSLCVPACFVGGLVAGLIAFDGARRSSSPGATLMVAGSVAVLTGSLGCACVGFSGVLGLVAGLGSTFLLGRALAWKPAAM
jgi:hypothetical protein